jgi:hypothetical protein
LCGGIGLQISFDQMIQEFESADKIRFTGAIRTDKNVQVTQFQVKVPDRFIISYFYPV